MTIGQFRNDAARLRFLRAYDTVLDRLWPGPRKAVDAPTAFGITRVYRSGSGSGSPIVLLPGAGGNSLMWHRYVPALGAHREVITVDTIGEPGASVQQAPMRDGHDGAAWLDQLLTALDLTSAHIVGCSYGVGSPSTTRSTSPRTGSPPSPCSTRPASPTPARASTAG